MAHAWNRYSEVAACPDCNGMGVLPGYQRATIHDPYPERPCDCGLGEHLPECSVCGSTVEVPGYDCFVCQMVYDLPDSLLTPATAATLSAAIARAIGVAAASQRKAA